MIDAAIEVRVAAVEPVRRQSADPLYRVILEEVGGPARLFVMVRRPEADSIAMHLQGTPTRRPMTFNFVASLFPALGARLLETRVTGLEDRTILATAVVDGPLGRRSLDVRPSDGINLALRLGAPIRVDAPALEALRLPAEPGQQDGLSWL